MEKKIKINRIKTVLAEKDISHKELAIRVGVAPNSVSARFNNRTITRTPSKSSELSVGACINDSVTVLSMRTTDPSSNFCCRALLNTARLIASQLAALIALIVCCKTDFFGDHDRGRRANEINDAESSK